MNKVYHPSGHISILFAPFFIIFLILTIIATLLCDFCILLSPSSFLDVSIYIFFIEIIAKLGAMFCIQYGKVRSPAVATISGIFTAIFHWYLLFVFYMPLKTVLATKSFKILQQTSKQSFQFLRFSEFWKMFNYIKNNLIVITGKSGNKWFDMPGTICIALLSIMFIIIVIYIAVIFQKKSRYPFCEISNRWAKEFTLICGVPEDEKLFLSKLMLGDISVISDLITLQEAYTDYYQISLFVTALNDNFYISITKMEKTQKVNRLKKRPVFQDRLLIEYLTIDVNTGLSLVVSLPDKLEEVMEYID